MERGFSKTWNKILAIIKPTRAVSQALEADMCVCVEKSRFPICTTYC